MRPILPVMESTIEETPIYEIVIIHMELSKATTNISLPHTCDVVSLVTKLGYSSVHFTATSDR